MKSGRRSAGHPVDIASGTVFWENEDVSIVGKVDLTWQRRYSTALLEDSPSSSLGAGWTTRYSATLSKHRGEYHFVSPDGTEVFSDPDEAIEAGGIVRNLGTFQELSRADNEYTVTLWDVDTHEIVRFVFVRGPPGGPWPLVRIEDMAGQALLLDHDGNGRLTRIQQRLEQRALQIEYDPLERIQGVSFVSPDGSRQPLARYEYDAGGRLRAAYDSRGYVDRYEYDAWGRIVREVLRDGGAFTFEYDNSGRCVRTSGADGYDEKVFRFRSEIGWTEVTNSRGYTRQYQWLPTGQVIAEIGPLGGVERTEYDDHGRILARTNSLGASEEYEYDTRGNRSKITNALGQSTEIVYNEYHQIVEFTSPGDHTSYREYDERNRLIASVDSEGNRYSLHFDGHGNLVEVTDPAGGQLRQTFDARGVRSSLEDWKGNITRYEADPMGRVVGIVDPLGHRKRLYYDLASNLTRVEYPDGTSNDFEYDPGNNLVQVIDRNGAATRYRFGTCRRLIERVDPADGTMRFRWGSEPANLETITNAKGEVYAFQYNEIGLVSKEIGFDGRELQFEYDLARKRIATINALGERTEYERDVGGRLVREILPDGSETSYSYDPAGFLEEVRNADSELRFEHDTLGQVVREVQNGRVIKRQYDPTGNVVQLQSDLGLDVTYRFDGNSQLSWLQVEGQDPISIQRDPRGAESTRSLPGGTTITQYHDEMGRLVDQIVSAPATRRLRRSYHFERDQLAAIRDQRGETVYNYDPLRRVVQSLREAGASERFDYDATDNLTLATRGTDSREFRHGQGDRLLSSNDTDYKYDPQGRLVRKLVTRPDGSTDEWRYEWNALDQLRAVTNPHGERWQYAYDPFGRRIEKRLPDGTSHCFVWDIDHIIHELSDQEVTASWIFDPHSFTPLCKLEGQSLYAVIADHLGTPREMLDRTGTIVWERDQFVWGETHEQRIGNVDCPIRFQGQWYDQESGFHYNRYRYYDPAIGRFVSQDPTRLMGAMNLYAYVFDPNMWIDPLGLVINTTEDRTHVTYVGSKGGEPYVGYASMPGDRTGGEVLGYRYSSGFASEDLDGTPRVVYRGYGSDLDSSRAAKATARGLEQWNFEQLGGLEGTANRQRPVGPNNSNRNAYLTAADEHLQRQQEEEDGCG